MDIEKITMRKVFWRVMPLLLAGALMSNLDRLNVGYAAIKMNAELGISAAGYGLAISAFFAGYVVVGVPSNLMLERIGARRWFAILLIAWGLLSSATGLVRGLGDLVLVRALLGLAEGGYTPGVLIFLTFWVPASYRGRFVGWTVFASAVGTVLSPVLSSLIVGSDGVAGLPGWRLMFIVLGLPACVIGALIWRFLADSPGEVAWLAETERAWLIAHLDERRTDEPKLGVWQLLTTTLDWRMVLMATIFILIAMCGYAIVAFLPLILQNLSYPIEVLGLVLALPPFLSGLCAPLWGRWSDKAQRKEDPCMAGCLLAATGLVGMAIFNDSPLAIFAGCMAFVGTSGANVTFWPLQLGYLKGRAAAFAVAFLYAVGSIGGIISPVTFGLLRDLTSDFVVSLLTLAAVAILAAGCVMAIRFVTVTRRELAKDI